MDAQGRTGRRKSGGGAADEAERAGRAGQLVLATSLAMSTSIAHPHAPSKSAESGPVSASCSEPAIWLEKAYWYESGPGRQIHAMAMSTSK